MDARELLRMIGPRRAAEAVSAGRLFLGGEKKAFTRDEVNLISTLEAHHIAVEALAHELGDCAACREGLHPTLAERVRLAAARERLAAFSDQLEARGAVYAREGRVGRALENAERARDIRLLVGQQ